MAALGDPSSRKSAPLDLMTKPLWTIQEEARVDYREAMTIWEAEAERAKVERAKWQGEMKDLAGTAAGNVPLPALAIEPEKPAERRTVISDATPEAVANVLADNPQGVLSYNDELAGWIASFDKYTSGGRPFWLSGYGGRPHNITRKGAGSINLPFLGVSVLGSIQPDKITDLLSEANDGLVPRILWAWPEKQVPRRCDRTANLDGLGNAYRRLDQLAWGSDADGGQAPVILTLDDKAAAIFEGWDADNANSAEDRGALYETFVGKMGGAVLRLALVAQLTRWAFEGGAEPSTVSAECLADAIDWVEEYAKPMALRVYGDAAVTESERGAALLARYIKRNGLAVINVREIRRTSDLKALKRGTVLAEAIAHLEEANWLTPAPSREGGSPGQKRKDYAVNSLVFQE